MPKIRETPVEESLEPCPFDGCTNVIIEESLDKKYTRVVCSFCDCSRGWCDNIYDTMDKWSDRRAMETCVADEKEIDDIINANSNLIIREG